MGFKKFDSYISDCGCSFALPGEDPLDGGSRSVRRDVLICNFWVRIMSENQVGKVGSSHRCGRRCGLGCGLLRLTTAGFGHHLFLAPTRPVEQETVAVPLERVVGHVHVHLDLIARPIPQVAEHRRSGK